MKVDVLLGLQWGDEGKGKIVDFLSPQYDIVARFQGGPNAGHTIEFLGKKYVLHLIPSGIFREKTMNVIGNGVVFDPVTFVEEVENIKENANVKENLIISSKAHLILPTHKLLDAAYEKMKGKAKIGSTLRGIAPTYTDKIARNGIRIGDIFEKDFEQKLKELTDYHKKLLGFLEFDYQIDKAFEEWNKAIEELRNYKIKNTEFYINEQLRNDKRILAEGAQGTMLDIEFGTYPFVTSSHTVSSGACVGLGVAPTKIDRIFGIFKAYTTRVGSGPFPTELNDKYGQKLRDAGNEYGATTGRPRRCGWLDLVQLRYSIMINGVTDLIMTKADVLSGFDFLNVANKYSINSRETYDFPFDIVNKKIIPVYEKMKAWKEDISKITNIKKMPEEFIDYLAYIEDITSTKISYVSNGAERKSIVSL
jgi:adenylosuccinate synthase